MNKVERFHYDRRMFAFIGKRLVIGNKRDIRDHATWLEEDYNTTTVALRGYVNETGLYFYNVSFDASDDDIAMMKLYLEQLADRLDLPDVKIFAGTIKGKPGDQWHGKRYLGRLSEFIPASHFTG